MMELLAPAGSPEAVTAAVENGAGAVYLGYGDFNARRRAKNFSAEELSAAVAYCHVRGAKVYLTLNTLLSDRELPAALEVGRLANDLGVDAVLVQDLGLAGALKSAFPHLPLHGSTQMTVHSLDGVKFCARQGLERVVLSRELSREAIAAICAQSPIEIEVFVHGALCMCYSGQCFLSAMLGGRSGNRGLCAQPCRLPYNGGHPLSLKDSSLAGHLRELEEMGVACVKIEGRMKRPEYVAVVTRVYAAALRERREPTAQELEALASAFSRSGFTQGYFLDQKGPQMFGTRTESDPPDSLYAQARSTYQKPQPLVPISLDVTLRGGTPLTAVLTDPAGRTVTRTGPVPEPARTRPLTEEEILEQFSKLGGTPYFVQNFTLTLEEGLSLPKSALNALRRDLADTLTALRSTPPQRPAYPLPTFSPPVSTPEQGQFIFTLRSIDQLTPELWHIPHLRIDLPPEQLLRDPEKAGRAMGEGAVLSAALPRICWDRERPQLARQLSALWDMGIRHALVPTWDLLDMAQSQGFALHGDFGLGVYNSRTLHRLQALGFSSATVSFELKEPMIRDLDKYLPTEAIVYGHLPLMMLEQPPGGTAPAPLTDRLGVTFPVVDAPGGRAELLNSQPLYLADKPRWRDALGLAGLRLLFTTEAPGQCVRMAHAYLTQQPPPQSLSFTRGLYYRDVE